MTDRARALLDDVLDEPAHLDALLAAYAAPGGPLAAVPADTRGRRLVFLGLGSSRYAALDAAADLAAAGVTARAEHASEPLITPPASDLVAVVISASGRTPEAVAAARRHRGTSLVIALTNAVAGPLAAEGDVVLPLMAGTETAGISTRTYQATNAVLAMLGARLGGVGLDDVGLADVPALLQRLIEDRSRWLPGAVEAFDGAERIGVMGAPRELGLVEQAALMLREAPRLHATAHETADWLHTGIYTALPGYRALLYAGSPADDDVLRTIRRRDGATVVVGSAGSDIDLGLPEDAPVFVRRLVASAIAELLAAALWEGSGPRGKGRLSPGSRYG